MRDLTQPPPAIKLTQQKQEAKFMCSACGADRGCNCNAPAVEKLAEKMEQDRQRAKTYRDRKHQENQSPRNVTLDEIMPTEAEEVTTQPRENSMQTEQAATVDESKIVNHLATEIIKEGYETLRERFHYDKPTMTRLARARDNLCNNVIEW